MVPHMTMTNAKANKPRTVVGSVIDPMKLNIVGRKGCVDGSPIFNVLLPVYTANTPCVALSGSGSVQ